MGRAPCCDKANVKKGPWSPEEDAKLKEFIEKYGTGGNWISLPHKAGLKRCGKSCRLRWLNYLRPNIKHGEFSDDEDMIICTLFASIGSRWSIIAAQLPGRTDNDIKNYWNTKLKKKLLGIPPNSQRKTTTTTTNQHQHHHHQQQQQQFPFNTSTITCSAHHHDRHQPLLSGLDQCLNPTTINNTTQDAIFNYSTSHTIFQGPFTPNQYQVSFGDQQSCSSSDISSYGNKDQLELNEQNMGFESYLYGGLDDNQKLSLLGNCCNEELIRSLMINPSNYNTTLYNVDDQATSAATGGSFKYHF